MKAYELLYFMKVSLMFCKETASLFFYLCSLPSSLFFSEVLNELLLNLVLVSVRGLAFQSPRQQVLHAEGAQLSCLYSSKFSTRASFASWGHLAMARDIFDCHNWGGGATGIQQV